MNVLNPCISMALNAVLKNAHHPLLILALTLNLSSARRKLFAIIIFLLDIYTYVQDCHYNAAATLGKYGECAAMVGTYWVVVRLLLLTDIPLSATRYNGEAANPSFLPFRSRLERSANISWNLRGIGLNNQIRFIPPFNPIHQRSRFVLSKLGRLFLFGLILAALWGPIMHFELHKTFLKNEPPMQTVLGIAFRRVFWTILLVITCVTCQDIPYTIVSIIAVGIGYSDPTMWPPMHGSWREASTLTRFWG